MDTNFHKTRFLIWAGILFAQFLLFYTCSKIDFVVNTVDYFFELQKVVHQKLFSYFSFSVGDIVYVMLILQCVVLLIKSIRRKTRYQALKSLLMIINISYFLYQISWGLLYFQKPLLYKLSKDEISIEETKKLALKYLQICIKDRKEVKEDQNGVFVIPNLQEVKEEIISQQKRLPTSINTKKATGVLDLKQSLYSSMMSYTGILGYYNPFTAEAQYNPKLPAILLPSTLAHESAHQLGYAREQEASFIGFLISKNSILPEVKYSIDYFVLKSLLRALIDHHPDFVASILKNYSPGMKRDRANEIHFIKKHDNTIGTIFDYTNDLFLQSNQQEGNITYSYFVDLLVRYERQP